MGKKFIKKLLVLMAAMCMVIGMALPVQAVEGDEAGTAVTATTEDPANGILQVMLAYEDDGGQRTYFTGGTCFLINEEYVVTNKHIFDLAVADSETGLTTREIIMQTLGLDELPDNDPHLKLFVFANRDTNVEATVHENAQSDVLDFAASSKGNVLFLKIGDCVKFVSFAGWIILSAGAAPTRILVCGVFVFCVFGSC